MAAVTKLWAQATIFLILISVGEVLGGSYCYSQNYQSSTYCVNGCCGSRGYQSCCSSTSTAIIVGAVLGGLFLISAVVTIVCCLIKKKAHSGKVVSPAPGSLATRPGVRATSTVTTTTIPAGHYANMQAHHPAQGAMYGYHHLPPIQLPAYSPPEAPPAYEMYNVAPPQGASGSTSQGQPAYYGYGQGQSPAGIHSAPATGVPTTQYGGRFVA